MNKTVTTGSSCRVKARATVLSAADHLLRAETLQRRREFRSTPKPAPKGARPPGKIAVAPRGSDSVCHRELSRRRRVGDQKHESDVGQRPADNPDPLADLGLGTPLTKAKRHQAVTSSDGGTARATTPSWCGPNEVSENPARTGRQDRYRHPHKQREARKRHVTGGEPWDRAAVTALLQDERGPRCSYAKSRPFVLWRRFFRRLAFSSSPMMNMYKMMPSWVHHTEERSDGWRKDGGRIFLSLR